MKYVKFTLACFVLSFAAAGCNSKPEDVGHCHCTAFKCYCDKQSHCHDNVQKEEGKLP